LKKDLIDIRNMTRKGLEAWAEGQGLQPFRGRQIFKWLWLDRPAAFRDFTDISKGLRAQLEEQFFLYDLVAVSKQVSRDGTIKWAFRLSDGETVESVLIPEADHTTLCLSTQVGCRMGCRFCLTARMGFSRNLTASEIAGQALAAIRLLKEGSPAIQRPRNIVFMGMGEPLDNLSNLIAAIEILTDELGLNFSLRRITVSTSGLVPEMIELGKALDIGLAVSLHATTNQVRDRLMPINRRFPIERLMKGCRDFPMSKRRRITFEYLMLKGINDSVDDARRLVRLLKGIPSKVNLIPFNPCPELPFEASDKEAIARFQEILKGANLTAIIRKSKGQDILAACGQLNSRLSRRMARIEPQAA